MKNSRSFQGPLLLCARLAAAALLCLLLLPVSSLLLEIRWLDLVTAAQQPAFLSALYLSLKTTLISLVILVLCGLPLAWWLADPESSTRNVLRSVIEFPVVLPPAVVGLGFLIAFGPEGWIGGLLDIWDLQIVFSGWAVILSQIAVAAPFFILAATNAFSRVDPELLIVARTLGASPLGAFVQIALPLAYRGLLSAAALAWARAMGEFGATLIFAGNLPGKTQTLSLALYQTMESDMRIALAIALCMAAMALFFLVPLRIYSDLPGQRK